jgi:hypothetical protein
MENLVAIVEVLSRYRMEEIDVIANPNSDSRFTELYRLIKDGIIKTDKEAEAYFYGNNDTVSDEDKKNKNYYSFKSRFKDTLMNTLYFVDKENKLFNDFQKTYYSTQLEWGAINILYRRNIIHTANNLAEKLLRTCIKYEFTDLCVQILDKLKSNTAFQTGNKKKYKSYKKDFWHYKDVWNAEHIAQECFEEIKIEYVKLTSFRPKNSAKANEYIIKLNELRKSHDSFVFSAYYFALKEAVYSTKHDWESVLKTCDEAISYYVNKPFEVKTYIAAFKTQKAATLLMLRKYDDCKKTLDDVFKSEEEGNMSWFKTMETKILLSFHTQNYTDAYHIYKYVESVKEFKNLKGQDIEIWLLFEVYLNFVISLNKITDLDRKMLTPFSLGSFLNKIPTFENDKRGMNISVLIAKICLILARKDYDKLKKYTEGIQKYLVRNVPKRDNASYRTNLFIKALLEIPKANYSKITLMRRLEKTMTDLSKSSTKIIETAYKIEIIPYEIIWSEILNTFKK